MTAVLGSGPSARESEPLLDDRFRRPHTVRLLINCPASSFESAGFSPMVFSIYRIFALETWPKRSMIWLKEHAKLICCSAAPNGEIKES
jgi:hypothetical protein